jgi:hypothetical protein
VSNAKDVLGMGEEAWKMAIRPLNYSLDAVRGKGFRNLAPPELDPGQIWDWAGVEGEWCGSYAFLESVSFCVTVLIESGTGADSQVTPIGSH